MSRGDQLVAMVERATGVVVPEADVERLLKLAGDLAARQSAGNLERFMAALRRDPTHDGWRALLSAITVKESYLFRASRQFEVLTDEIVPELLRRRRPGQELVAWCAGCARGEEAVTLAMVLTECPALAGRRWRILATDVDEQALEEARAGRYGQRAVARVPRLLQDRYLRRSGGGFQVAPSLLDRIDYRQLNLVRMPLAVPGTPFDLVLLRNVLIYFRPDLQGRVVTAVAEALREDGVLFLGPSESLLQLSVPLVAEDRGGCFIHRRPAPSEPPGPEVPGADTPARSRRSRAEPRRVPQPRPTLPPPEQPPQVTVDDIVDALVGGDPNLAVSLAGAATARRPEDAGLRGLLGIALLRTDSPADAIRELRAAVYLEPSLIQVRILLADALATAGAADRARRELRAAVATISAGRTRWLPRWSELGLPDADEILARCQSEMRVSKP